MKFSGKMSLMIILKVSKNQGFTLCLEDTFFEKTPHPAVLGLCRSATREATRIPSLLY